MLSKYKNVFFLCAISIILCLMLFFVESKKIEPKISNNNLQPNEKEYTIYSNLSRYHIGNVDKNIIVNAKPVDNKYGLINIAENFRNILRPGQRLTISLKRIAELNKWGEDIPLIKKTNNVEDLKTWWIPYKNDPLTFIKKDRLNSWESIFARYLFSIEDYINYIKSQEISEKNALAIVLRLSLTESQQQINKDIYNSKRNIKDKEYLQNLSDSIFYDLNSRVDQIIPKYNPITHHYNLVNIKKDREYGIYEISISRPSDIKFDWGNVKIQQKKSRFKPNIDSQPYKDLLFSNIEITPNLNELTFNLPDIKNSVQNDWTSEINQSDQKYKYILNLKEINPKLEYLLSLTYQTIYPLDISIEELQESFTNDNQIIRHKYNEIWKDVILSPKNQSYYQRKISFTRDDKFNTYNIILKSAKPLPENFFNDLKLQILPIYEPVITLKKTAKLNDSKIQFHIEKIKEDTYLVTLNNMSLLEENKTKSALDFTYWIVKEISHQNTTSLTIIFWPPIIIKTILFILITFIVIKLTYEIYLKQLLENNKELCQPLINRSKNYLNFLPKITCLSANFIYSKLKEIKLILFIIMLVIISIDIYLRNFGIIKEESLILIYIGNIFWLITLIGYRGKNILSFYMSLMLFALFSITLIINLTIISERILTWSYVFLLIGSIHALIEICIKRNFDYEKNNTIPIFPKLLSLLPITEKFLNHCGHLLDKLLTTVLKSLDTLIGKITFKLWNFKLFRLYQHIKANFNKSIQYSSKSTVFLTAIVTTYMIVLFINIGLQSFNQYLTKESRNPVVKNYEPRFVYHATKVIIKGKNFGWNNRGEELISNFGKVSTDFWSNEKIIFTVPLHWKAGEISLRLEKPNMWQGKPIISNSKTMIFWLLPITASFTDDDDDFYEQMKLLDEETQKLNGYGY